MTVGGIILAGGKSTRMGTSKALLPFGGETMLQRVVRVLGGVVSPLVATEALWGVVLSAVLLRQSELVGARLVLGACLVVAGGALIGTFR